MIEVQVDVVFYLVLQVGMELLQFGEEDGIEYVVQIFYFFGFVCVGFEIDDVFYCGYVMEVLLVE